MMRSAPQAQRQSEESAAAVAVAAANHVTGGAPNRQGSAGLALHKAPTAPVGQTHLLRSASNGAAATALLSLPPPSLGSLDSMASNLDAPLNGGIRCASSWRASCRALIVLAVVD